MLSGPLPENGLGKLNALASLELDDNKLSGEIPRDLPKNLRRLHLTGNRLVRDLPPGFYKCLGLSDVALQDNYLSGPLSDDIASLKRLRVFRMDGNRHTERDRGVISESIAAFLPGLVASKGFRI